VEEHPIYAFAKKYNPSLGDAEIKAKYIDNGKYLETMGWMREEMYPDMDQDAFLTKFHTKYPDLSKKKEPTVSGASSSAGSSYSWESGRPKLEGVAPVASRYTTTQTIGMGQGELALEKARKRGNFEKAADLDDYTQQQVQGSILAPEKEYQARLSTLQSDSGNLQRAIEASEARIAERWGNDWHKEYNARASAINDPETKNREELIKQQEEFESNQFVNERNNFITALEANHESGKQILKDDKYAYARALEEYDANRQKKSETQGWGNLTLGILQRSAGKLFGSVGEVMNIGENLVTQDKTYGTWDKIEDFFIDFQEQTAKVAPRPTKYTRPLYTKTAKIERDGEKLEIDFVDGKPSVVRDSKGAVTNFRADILGQGLTPKNQYNGKGLIYQTGEVLADAMVQIATTKGIGGTLVKTGMGAKAAYATGVTASTMGQMAGGLYDQGLKMFDGDKRKAAQYATMTGLAIGASSNLFGMEARLAGGPGLFDDLTIAQAAKGLTPKMAAARTATNWVKGGAGEMTEETVIEKGIEGATAMVLGGEAEDINLNEMKGTALISFATGLIMTGGSNDFTNSAWLVAAENPEEFKKALQAEVANGKKVDVEKMYNKALKIKGLSEIKEVREEDIPKLDELTDLKDKAEKAKAIGADAQAKVFKEQAEAKEVEIFKESEEEVIPDEAIAEEKPAPIKPSDDLIGKQFTYNGYTGELKKEGERYVIENERQIIELDEDAELEEMKEAQAEDKPLSKQYEISSIDDESATINGVDYSIVSDDKGNIVGLSPKEKPDQVIKNERMLVAAEIQRNKQEAVKFRDVPDEQYSAIKAEHEDGEAIEMALASGMNETISNAIDALYDEKQLDDDSALELAYWIDDRVAALEELGTPSAQNAVRNLNTIKERIYESSSKDARANVPKKRVKKAQKAMAVKPAIAESKQEQEGFKAMQEAFEFDAERRGLSTSVETTQADPVATGNATENTSSGAEARMDTDIPNKQSTTPVKSTGELMDDLVNEVYEEYSGDEASEKIDELFKSEKWNDLQSQLDAENPLGPSTGDFKSTLSPEDIKEYEELEGLRTKAVSLDKDKGYKPNVLSKKEKDRYKELSDKFSPMYNKYASEKIEANKLSSEEAKASNEAARTVGGKPNTQMAAEVFKGSTDGVVFKNGFFGFKLKESFIRAVKKLWNYTFYRDGNLPELASKLAQKRLGRIREQIKKADLSSERLRAMLKGKPEHRIRDINAALQNPNLGKQPLFYSDGTNIEEGILNELVEMRMHVDSLSSTLITEGISTGESAMTILGNLEFYLTQDLTVDFNQDWNKLNGYADAKLGRLDTKIEESEGAEQTEFKIEKLRVLAKKIQFHTANIEKAIRAKEDVPRKPGGVPSRKDIGKAYETGVYKYSDGTEMEPEIIRDLRAMKEISKEIEKGIADLKLLGTLNMADMPMYLTRSYQVHWDKDWFDNVQKTEAFTNAVRFFREQKAKEKDDLIVLIEFYKQKVNALNPASSAPEAQGTTTEASEFYKEKLRKAEIELSEIDMFDPVAEAKASLHQQADKSGSFSSSASLGSSSAGSFAKRKLIPDEIRALWGESKDPILNYMTSVYKIAHILENRRFVREVVKQGEGKFLHPFPIGDFFAKFPTTADELADYHSTPEIVEAFKIYNQSITQSDPTNAFHRAVDALAYASGVVKKNLTVLSIASAARNFFYNPFAMIQRGAWNPLSKNVGDAIKYFRKGTEKETLELYRLGILGDDLISGPLAEIRKDYQRRTGEPILPGPVGKTWFPALAEKMRSITRGMEIAYAFGDNFYKVIDFYRQREKLAKLYKNKKYEDLLVSEQEDIKEMAAERILSEHASYSTLPRGMRILAKQPFIAPFAPHPYEMIRNTKNMFANAIKDARDGSDFKENGLSTKQMELLKSMLGQMFVFGGIPLIGGLIRSAMSGMSDDDEEKLRYFLPVYHENSYIIPISNDNGKVHYLDISGVLPQGHMLSTLNNLSDGRFGPAERADNALAKFMQPFTSVDPLTRSMAESFLGYQIDSPERKISIKGEEEWLKTRIWNIAGKKGPGTLNSLMRIHEAMTNPRTDLITSNEVMSLGLGARVYNIDVVNNFGFAALEVADKLQDTFGEYDRMIRSKAFGKLSPAQQEAEKKKTIERETKDYYRFANEFRRVYLAAKTFPGIDQRAVDQKMARLGLDAYVVKGIMSGDIKEPRFGK